MPPTLFALLQAGAEKLHVWQLILDASPVVMLVMLALVVMSAGCWFVIGAKLLRLRQATGLSERFLTRFWEGEATEPWSAARLEGVYAELRSFDGSPIAALFRAGYVELARIAGAEAPAGGGTENIERALRRAKTSELTKLESYVPFLATTGSTAPFVGLFGTVWGIMNSFIQLRNSDASATLDAVAPGIAEALIATAIGLVAAIPAVMAYNYFVRRIQVLENEMDAFASDYLNIVRRQFLSE
ncbi:MAG: protein TolQ [Myxococcales bacterium]|nr:protein TolQ [Myxococcales bacterium]